MTNAYGSDIESFRVDPQTIAESIGLKQEIERLKKENCELRNRIKKNANGYDTSARESVAPLRPLSASEFLTLELPPRELIIDPWLPTKGLAMVHSKRGAGKTFLLLGAAYAVSCGEDFLGFNISKPRRVLFIDGEMPGESMQRRLAALVQSFAKEPPDPAYFRILSADTTESGLPDLGATSGQAELDAAIGDAEVVFVDNLSTLVRSGKENEGDSWLSVQGWALAHRRGGRSVVVAHHTGKNGLQRGTSRREDVLDTVIHLRQPSDYSPEQGARFEVHYEKNRGFYGDDARSFEAKYEERNNAAMWTRTGLADVELDRVANALNEGMSIRDIAEMLGIHKSKVERLKNKAKEMGKLNV